MDPRLRIGDVVVADRLIQHDMDASPLPAFQRFEIPLLGKTYFEMDSGILQRAQLAAQSYANGRFFDDVPAERRAAFSIDQPAIYSGLIASGDQFLVNPAVTCELCAALPGLLCAEMEGAAVAQVCYEMGDVPAAVIRVISDQADHAAVVDFTRFLAEVAEHITGGIVRTLLQSFTDDTKNA